MTLLAVVAPLGAGPARAADAEGWTDIALLSQVDESSDSAPVDALVLPDGPLGPFTPLTQSLRAFVLGVSASGDRVLTSESVAQASTGLQDSSRLVVRDISGALVRTIPDLQDDVNGAALSPGGDRIAWSSGPSAPMLRVANVAGGAVTEVPIAVEVRGFVTDDLLVVKRSDGSLATADLAADGTLTPVTFLDGGQPAWGDLSRDGARLVFERDQGFTTNLLSAPVQRVGRAVTVGLPTLLAMGDISDLETVDPRVPSFTHDDADVVFTRGNRFGRQSSLARVPAGGGAVTRIAGDDLIRNPIRAALLGARETTSPAAPSSAGPASRAGATATVRYTVAADPTASFVVATRTSPGLPAKTIRAVVPNPLVDTGVVSGRTYTYAVRQVDRSGNTGPATTTVLRQSAPAAAVRFSGQQLTAGQLLRSTNGVRLRVNPDGNLVALSPSGNVLFQTRTRGAQSVLRVNPDGNLVLLSGSRVLWHARTAGQGTAALVAQNDGNVVLYRDRDGRAVWSTRGGRTS